MRTHLDRSTHRLCLPLAAAAESMRCGKWVVNETSSTAEILQKCGEPQQKEVKKEDVYARKTLGHSNKVGETVIERWHYKRSPARCPCW